MAAPHRLARSLWSGALTLALLVPTRIAIAAPAPEPAPPVTPVAPVDPVAVTPTAEREVPVTRVEASEDEVILLDGSFVRGKIVELSKGSHVTISTGEQRTIPWAEVQEVRVGTAPAQPATVTPVAPAEPTPMPRGESAYSGSGPGRPRVHIESRNGRTVNLYSIQGEIVASGSAGTMRGVAFRSVCTGTCDRVVDGTSGNAFFVGGDGVTASRRFRLAEETGRLTLDVKAGSRAAFVSGYVLSTLGGSALLIGAMLIPLSKQKSEYDTSGADRDIGMHKAGVGLAVAGSLALVSGIVMLVLGRTVVKKRRGG